MKSLKSSHHALAESFYQLQIIERSAEQKPFVSSLQGCGLYPLRPVALEIFQVNVGKMCNQTCRHCHVDAGPDRKEIMDKDTMRLCLDILRQNTSFTTVDITGGAPEMNPNFRWFVEEINRLGRKIIVRCNLTIIVANKKYNDLPAFFAQHRVEVVSSLPFTPETVPTDSAATASSMTASKQFNCLMKRAMVSKRPDLSSTWCTILPVHFFRQPRIVLKKISNKPCWQSLVFTSTNCLRSRICRSAVFSIT